MLTPEQRKEIRKVQAATCETPDWDLVRDRWMAKSVAIGALLSDRAEIAQELARIRETMIDYSETQTALTALIERIGK